MPTTASNQAPLQATVFSAAETLQGKTIEGGWLVTEKLPKPGGPGAEDLTGGCFSVGYIAHRNGQKAFLKVIDIGCALTVGQGPVMDRLRQMTDGHTFECALLDICQSSRLDRVVRILAKGEMPPAPNSFFPIPVPYILFEWAEGDVRKVVSRADKIELAWKFRILHDVAVGLQQLHGQHIAHQDLKPSNVLLFGVNEVAKIGDLGRASLKGKEAAHDALAIAGAVAYAPPEQAYGICPSDWQDRREGCDLYHLGSLICFVFTGVTPNQHYNATVDSQTLPSCWGGGNGCHYEAALPILTSSFTAFLDRIQQDLPDWARADLTPMILHACNPDYRFRGDPGARAQVSRPLGIDRFVSRLDLLAKRAKVNSHS